MTAKRDALGLQVLIKELESVVTLIQDECKCSPELALLSLAQGVALMWLARRAVEMGEVTPQRLASVLATVEVSDFDFLFENVDEGLPRIWLMPRMNRELNKLDALILDSSQFVAAYDVVVSSIERSSGDFSAVDAVVLSSMNRLLRLRSNETVLVAAADLGDSIGAFLDVYPEHPCRAFVWTSVAWRIAKFRMVLRACGRQVSLSCDFLSWEKQFGEKFDAVCLLPPWGGGVMDQALDVHTIGFGWRATEVRAVVRAFECLKPGGKLIALLPERLLDRSEFQPFKKYILRTALLEALVSLPVETTSRRWRMNPCCLMAVRKKDVPVQDLEQMAKIWTVESRDEDAFREMEDVIGDWQAHG